MSQDPEPLVLWKHEPKPKKPLVLWKHEPRSKNPRSLKTWARIQNLCSSENMSQSPKILGPLKIWTRIRRPPGKHILYSFKKKKKIACMNYVWTWSPHQEVRRQSPSRFGPHFEFVTSTHHFIHISQNILNLWMRLIFPETRSTFWICYSSCGKTELGLLLTPTNLSI